MLDHLQDSVLACPGSVYGHLGQAKGPHARLLDHGQQGRERGWAAQESGFEVSCHRSVRGQHLDRCAGNGIVGDASAPVRCGERAAR